MSRRRNWDSPNPSLDSECSPPPRTGGGGGHTRLRVRVWGSPNSDDWRKSLALGLLCATSRRLQRWKRTKAFLQLPPHAPTCVLGDDERVLVPFNHRSGEMINLWWINEQRRQKQTWFVYLQILRFQLAKYTERQVEISFNDAKKYHEYC